MQEHQEQGAQNFPPQKQTPPGLEAELNPKPRYEAPQYKGSSKLLGKKALITGGDSGIGRSVAVLFAREGADIGFTYLREEQPDAQETKEAVEREGRRCEIYECDFEESDSPESVVRNFIIDFGQIDILVSNAAYQRRQEDLESITRAQWTRTMKVNLDAYFFLVQTAVAHMPPGSSVIATSSVNGQAGNSALLDYSATKGGIDALTKSFAQMLLSKGIRVNAVAPGPVWTPLNPADEGSTPQKVSQFGSQVPYGRPAQPEEIAPAYVFLASNTDSSYVTGVILNEFGGRI